MLSTFVEIKQSDGVLFLNRSHIIQVYVSPKTEFVSFSLSNGSKLEFFGDEAKIAATAWDIAWVTAFPEPPHSGQ